MKKTLILLFFTLGAIALQAQRTVENPNYEARNTTALNISKIVLADEYTHVHARINYKPKWWFYVEKSMTISNASGSETYPILSMEGGELGEKITTPACGYYDVVMHFAAIDPNITSINLSEKDGWAIFGIDLTGLMKDTWNSLLPETLEGNWSDTSGKLGWQYGFYEDFAIVNNEFWDYESVEKKRGSYIIKLKNKEQTHTLYVKQRDTLLAIGKQPKPNTLYTTEQVSWSEKSIENNEINALKSGTAVFKGYIEDYSPKSGFATGLIYSNNDILRETKQTLVEFDNKGRFCVNIDLAHAQSAFMRIGKYYYTIPLIPNDTICIYMHIDDILDKRVEGRDYISPNMRFMGSKPRFTEEFMRMEEQLLLSNEKIYKQQKDSKSASEYLSAITKLYQQDSIKLERYIQKHKPTTLTQEIAKNVLHTTYFNGLVEYKWRQKDGNKRKTDTIAGFIRYSEDDSWIPEGYFDITKKIDTENIDALMFCSFQTFINRYEFMPGACHHRSTFIVPQGMLNLINAGVIKATELEKKGIKISITSYKAYAEGRKEDVVKLDSATDASLRKLALKNLPLVRELYVDTLTCSPMRQDYASLVERTNKLWKNEENILPQIAIIRSWKSRSKEANKKEAEATMQVALEFVKHPYLRECLIAYFNEKYNAAVQDTYPDIPEGSGKAILEKIVAPHRGKYMLIDFWATGCGPCIGAINRTHDVRERLKDEPIAFVFITDDHSSPLASYNKYMDKTQGSKHRISRDDWNKITALFNINSIPRYVLLDPAGKVISDDFKGGASAIERKLKELTEK